MQINETDEKRTLLLKTLRKLARLFLDNLSVLLIDIVLDNKVIQKKHLFKLEGPQGEEAPLHRLSKSQQEEVSATLELLE